MKTAEQLAEEYNKTRSQAMEPNELRELFIQAQVLNDSELEELTKHINNGYVKAYLAGYAEACRWISVKDEMPEEYVFLPILRNNEDKDLAMWDLGEWKQISTGKVLLDVTHWTQLPNYPAAPKEGE